MHTYIFLSQSWSSSVWWSLNLITQRCWRQFIIPWRKSLVTLDLVKTCKTIKALAMLTYCTYCPQQLMPTHGYSDLYGSQPFFWNHDSRYVFARWSCHLVLLTVKVSVAPFWGDRNGSEQSYHSMQTKDVFLWNSIVPSESCLKAIEFCSSQSVSEDRRVRKKIFV